MYLEPIEIVVISDRYAQSLHTEEKSVVTELVGKVDSLSCGWKGVSENLTQGIHWSCY